MFSPSSPASRHLSIAIWRRSTARGYSALTYITPSLAPIAFAPMIIPSITECGSASITDLSINAPGSPSSPLQSIYLMSETDFEANSHLRPVGKPAPPRPLKPESFITLIISSGVISVRAFAVAWYPSLAIYSSRLSGSIIPLFLSTLRT